MAWECFKTKFLLDIVDFFVNFNIGSFKQVKSLVFNWRVSFPIYFAVMVKINIFLNKWPSKCYFRKCQKTFGRDCFIIVGKSQKSVVMAQRWFNSSKLHVQLSEVPYAFGKKQQWNMNEYLGSCLACIVYMIVAIILVVGGHDFNFTCIKYYMYLWSLACKMALKWSKVTLNSNKSNFFYSTLVHLAI